MRSETHWGKTLDKQMIPFDRDGNQLMYPGWDTQFSPNEIFTDTLQFYDYGRGRSAAYFTFVRMSNRKRVHMFMTDFGDVVPMLSGGCIGGTFTFCKRGQNYGVKLVSVVKQEI
jgi:hypothetical protein